MKRPKCCAIRNLPCIMTPLPLATLLLAAHIVLSVAELTGDNVCHKRETYTVTMRVVVKEPMQVKTYTWCLKVPPRCTKFKIEMRDRLKNQTEMRERVVDVCCSGYVPDVTGTRCVPECSRCAHGVCATPDTCHCEPGYTGDRCDSECRDGLWGPACREQCHCQNGGTCNHVTGECRCPEGWRGSRCDITCPDGTYGQDCMKECYCEASDDAKNSACHHVTGECRLPGNTTNKNQQTNTHQPNIVLPTSSPEDNENSDMETYSALQTTERGVSRTEDMPTPIAEKHSVSTDEKFIALVTDTFMSVTTYPITVETVVKEQILDEYASSSVTNTVPPHDEQTSVPDSETERRLIHDTNFSRPAQQSDTTTSNTQTTNSEPQNIQMPSRGRPIIVISDSLLSERSDDSKNEESKNSVLYLVSSVSVAGGVALALIVMSVVTMFMSHCRNKVKVQIADHEMVPVRKQHQLTPAPQVYGYVEEVTACPVQHLFPNPEVEAPNGVPATDTLQLSFGNLSSTVTTNNNLGHTSHLYNNARAYLELQYDIPPSFISSRSNSMPPGMEPEHLYDEIPCWQSTTTASTNTDTSQC